MKRKTFLFTCLSALSVPFTGISSIFEKEDKWQKGKYSFNFEKVIYEEKMLYGGPFFTLVTSNKDIVFGLDYVKNQCCPLPENKVIKISKTGNRLAIKSEIFLLDDKKYKITNWECNSILQEVKFEII